MRIETTPTPHSTAVVQKGAVSRSCHWRQGKLIFFVCIIDSQLGGVGKVH